jgi:type IV pilus biogenesis/stability protein PilW
MIVEDSNRTYIDAQPAQVLDLFESTNQPLVQPTGRSAQAAQAVVVAVRTRAGVQVLVALTLTQTGENVIYASPVPVRESEAQQAFEEGLMFAESMGFILDTTGFRTLDTAHQHALIDRLAAFQSAPSRVEQPPPPRGKPTDTLSAVARLFAAFALLASLSLFACSGPSAEQRAQSAEIHYDLGTNLMNAGNTQGALQEYLLAQQEAPDLPQVHNALGLLYGFSFDQPAEAEAHFKQAVELQKDFSEAYNNYGALLLARGRFADAIPQFEKALGNPLYSGRAIAESNLGWALYKTGSVDKGVGRIRASLLVAPKYCKGWRQLGTIYADTNRLEQAAEAYGRYGAECPEAPDAFLQQGIVLARQSRAAEAKAAFTRCAELGKSRDAHVAGECQRFLRGMGAP